MGRISCSHDHRRARLAGQGHDYFPPAHDLVHAKLVTCDRHALLLGSANITSYAPRSNFEGVLLGASGIESVKLPPSSPNLNANAERFVRPIKEFCLERMILFGEGPLRKAIHEFMAKRRHPAAASAFFVPGASSDDQILP